MMESWFLGVGQFWEKGGFDRNVEEWRLLPTCNLPFSIIGKIGGEVATAVNQMRCQSELVSM